MLQSLTSGRLIVSLVIEAIGFRQIVYSVFNNQYIFYFLWADYDEHERSMLISQMSFEKTFGLSSVFIESTLMENGGVPESVNPAALINEAIHVIGCGYEEKTAWGKEVDFFILFLFSFENHVLLLPLF